MLPDFKVDVVLERGKDLEADTGPDVGTDSVEKIVEVGACLEELKLS